MRLSHSTVGCVDICRAPCSPYGGHVLWYTVSGQAFSKSMALSLTLTPLSPSVALISLVPGSNSSTKNGLLLSKNFEKCKSQALKVNGCLHRNSLTELTRIKPLEQLLVQHQNAFSMYIAAWCIWIFFLDSPSKPFSCDFGTPQHKVQARPLPSAKKHFLLFCLFFIFLPFYT